MQKFTLFMLVLALAGMMGYVIHHGRHYRATNSTLALAHHQGGTNWVMGILLLTIVLLETALWFGPKQEARSLLFVVHLTAAGFFLTSFLFLRFYLTGLRSTLHAAIAYFCAACFAATLLTGLPMFWNLRL